MAQNNWGTLQIQAPEFISPGTLAGINNLANFLNEVLTVAIDAMKLGEAAVAGYLDPIAAVVNALVSEINGTLHDFNQTGIYITGDWHLKANQLMGGYQAYQNRMVARLTDQTDPTRPNVSGVTPCLGIFVYLSDENSVETIIQFIKQLAAFFHQRKGKTSEYPTPVITQVLYGNNTASLTQTKDLASVFTTSSTPPNVAAVKWRITAPVQGALSQQFPSPTPAGFMLTVSTVPNGIDVAYDRPRTGDTKQPTVTNPNVKAQPREYGRVTTPSGKPLTLYGGADMISIPPEMAYNAGISAGSLRDGYTRVYGLIHGTNQRVPLDQLKSGNTYYFQRTFYFRQNPAYTWLTNEFSTLMNASDMPHAAHVTENSDGTLTIVDDGPAPTIFLRISAIGSTVASFQYGFDTAKKNVNGQPIIATESGGSTENVGPFSQPKPLVFPNVNTQQYLEALQAGLLVLALTRPDLDPLDTLMTTVPAPTFLAIQGNNQVRPYVALQRSGLESCYRLANKLYDAEYRKIIEHKNDDSALIFRQDLLHRVQQLAHAIYSTSGPMPDVEAFVVQNTKNLRTATWQDIMKSAHAELLTEMNGASVLKTTLLGSLSDPSIQTGIARNPYCLGLAESDVNFILRSSSVLDRDPQMQSVPLAPLDPNWTAPMVVSASAAPNFLASLPAGLKIIYEKCTLADGSILVPNNWEPLITQAAASPGNTGSADISPVLVINRDALTTLGTTPGLLDIGSLSGNITSATSGNLLYCRGIFAKAMGGAILKEAAIALGIAGAATSRKENLGQWIALRVFDTYPAAEDVLSMITNWAQSVQYATLDATDHLSKAIENLESRVAELQQLIRRIDSLIQMLTGFTYLLPACSALVTVSNGTGGLLSDLVSSQSKPNDSPTAFGGGLCLVVPVPLGGIVLDLLQVFLSTSPGSPGDTATGSPSSLGIIPTAPGVGALPAAVPASPTPDVL